MDAIDLPCKPYCSEAGCNHAFRKRLIHSKSSLIAYVSASRRLISHLKSFYKDKISISEECLSIAYIDWIILLSSIIIDQSIIICLIDTYSRLIPWIEFIEIELMEEKMIDRDGFF